MSNTFTPTVFYRTLIVEGLEIFYKIRMHLGRASGFLETFTEPAS